MKQQLIVLTLVATLATACSDLQNIANTIYQQQPLTQTEIIGGLKQALTVGVDSSVGQLAGLNGYLNDAAVKILLPDEAQTITKNISKLPGGQQLVDKVITNINRAASDAAKEATPILISSIKSMTIQDAAGILTGGNNAATEYMKRSNYNALLALYKPKIETSLDKKLVGTLTAQQSWDELTGNWNKLANSLVGKTANLEAVNTDLSDYLTRKALDGLFLKIAETEKDIRQDPAARVTDLLKRVFGKAQNM